MWTDVNPQIVQKGHNKAGIRLDAWLRLWHKTIMLRCYKTAGISP